SLESGAEAFQRGAVEEAAARGANAEEAYAQKGESANRITALIHLARAQSEQGQYRQAAVSLSNAPQLARQRGDQRSLGAANAAVGTVYIVLGPPETAEQYLRNALGIARELQEPALVAAALNDLGNLLTTRQQYAAALSAYRECIGLAAGSHLDLLQARARINAAAALRAAGHPREALAMLDQSLGGLRTLAPSHDVAFSLVGAGLGYRDLRPALVDERDRLLQQAGAVLKYAAQTAERIGDRRTASYALGYL